MTKTETNVRGSPNPWVTSTKTVTSSDLYYNKKLQFTQQHFVSFLSTLLTYSPSDSISKLIMNLAENYIHCNIIKNKLVGFPHFSNASLSTLCK